MMSEDVTFESLKIIFKRLPQIINNGTFKFQFETISVCKTHLESAINLKTC